MRIVRVYVVGKALLYVGTGVLIVVVSDDQLRCGETGSLPEIERGPNRISEAGQTL